jgi:hypothetical protein
MMDLTGNPIWHLKYSGSEMPKITTLLSEAQEFVSSHEVESITFYVSMMLTEPGRGGLERDFKKREMSKEELLSLTQAWVEQTMEETGKLAAKDFGLVDSSKALAEKSE